MTNAFNPAAAKAAMRSMGRASLCAAYGLARLASLPVGGPRESVAIVVERNDWAIRWVGTYIRQGIERSHPGTVAVTTAPAPLFRQVVHFGSQYQWETWGPHMSPENRYVTSFFHGKPEDGPDAARHIDGFLASVPRLSRIVVSSSLAEERLHRWGVPPEKTVRIPIGCDTELFRPPADEARRGVRRDLGIPDDAVCIGSFQKDGQGWGEGLEPKPIKGPDLFVDLARRLAGNMPLWVLLCGPARGYVKKGLEDAGIPYVHRFMDDYRDIAPLYHALDLYAVTSREEGGPMALMEAMASHVDVVSTRVGQAPDLIEDGVTGGLADVGDVGTLASRAEALLSDAPERREARHAAARKRVVEAFDWSLVAARHYDLVYRPLIDNLGPR